MMGSSMSIYPHTHTISHIPPTHNTTMAAKTHHTTGGSIRHTPSGTNQILLKELHLQTSSSGAARWAQWVSAVASQQEGHGFVSGPARAFLCGVCHVLPVFLRGFSSGYSGFLPIQKTCTGNAKHNTVLVKIG